MTVAARAEHDLDAVAPFVSTLVVLDGLVAWLSPRDAGRYSLIYKVLLKQIRRRKTAHLSMSTSIVADLPGEPNRTSRRVSHGMQDNSFRELYSLEIDHTSGLSPISHGATTSVNNQR